MEEGRTIGFNVLRLWAHSVSPEYALQVSPGEYNEAVMVLDVLSILASLSCIAVE